MLANISDQIIELLFVIPCVLIALTVHEVAHGYMAFRLGDPTARNLGRLTLNPLKHLDPIGTICMIFFHFGWARPVPINSRYFRKPRRDMALTAAAGPVSNFIMAFIGALLYAILYTIFANNPAPSNFLAYLQVAALQLLQYFHILNLSLGVFNLIPVPPLDGSRIFLTFLPAKYYFGIMKYERYIQIGLMILLYLGLLSRPLSAAVSWLSSGMFRVVSFLPFL
ncbi:MAG: site-2 protease family protein [Clostridia bacterium]|nr:site-2 protease family protein [Clostridia bacterium]MBQ8370738.1 site-2 protease family protein [Clostridia bacterium]MBQ8513004.1 site-2 protease family protein [Clostridia bacterium]